MPKSGTYIFYPSSLYILFLILLSFLSVQPIDAQRYPDSTVDGLLNRGINSVLLQDYKAAEKSFSELNIKYPDLPFGCIYLAAVQISGSYDFASGFNDKQISNYLDQALYKSEKLLKKDEENIWNIYAYALVKGYCSYYKALKKDWFSAVSNGLDSYNAFNKCLEMDSLFYDAYTALGSFKYWKSKKTELIKWLTGDEKEIGIKYLQQAILHPSYNTYLAVHSLQWIYIEQRNYSDAIDLSISALKKYPGCRFFMWGLGRAYEEIDRRKAVKIYYELLESYLIINKLNKVHEILLKHLIAQQYEKLGDYKKALKICNEILNIDFTSSDKIDRINRRIERVKELKEKLLSEINK